MKIMVEENKYYMTNKGWVVGPARKISNPWAASWATYSNGCSLFEIVGLKPEQVFGLELVEEYVAPKVNTLYKVEGEYSVFYFSSPQLEKLARENPYPTRYADVVVDKTNNSIIKNRYGLEEVFDVYLQYK